MPAIDRSCRTCMLVRAVGDAWVVAAVVDDAADGVVDDAGAGAAAS